MEKEEVSHLEQIETNQSDLKDNELRQEHTLQYVDLENRYAFKGDDSDGKIEWTVRKLFASAFLAMLYTGIISQKAVSAFDKSNQTVTNRP
jgi:hypothetical protein